MLKSNGCSFESLLEFNLGQMTVLELQLYIGDGTYPAGSPERK